MRSLKKVAVGSVVPPVILTLIAIDILLCMMYVMNLLLDAPSSKLTALLDLNGENSIPAWYSSMQYFLAFLLSSVYVKNLVRQNSKAILLLLLPAMFLLMSIDESVMIHEWLGRRTDVLLPGGDRAGTMFQQTGIWMIVLGLPFLILFFSWARSVRKHLPSPALNKLVLGLCIMLSGALGCEFISNFIRSSFVTAEIVLEEGLEMIGTTIMLWAVYELVTEYVDEMVPGTGATEPAMIRSFPVKTVPPVE